MNREERTGRGRSVAARTELDSSNLDPFDSSNLDPSNLVLNLEPAFCGNGVRAVELFKLCM